MSSTQVALAILGHGKTQSSKVAHWGHTRDTPLKTVPRIAYIQTVVCEEDLVPLVWSSVLAWTCTGPGQSLYQCHASWSAQFWTVVVIIHK